MIIIDVQILPYAPKKKPAYSQEEHDSPYGAGVTSKGVLFEYPTKITPYIFANARPIVLKLTNIDAQILYEPHQKNA